MTKGVFILFLLFSFFFLLQFLISPNIINGNDLNGNIVPLLHFQKSILVDHTFPFWNSYMGQGLPTTADPLYGIFNPLIGIPVLLFNYQSSIKVTYFLSVLFASIGMFLLARSYRISKNVSIILALSYASTAYIMARIIAGHIEKIVSYAFLPFFLLCVVNLIRKKNVFWAGSLAGVISLILFTGDIYNALYCLYAVGAIFLYYLFVDKKVSLFLIFSVFIFILFSAIKILPMVELQHYISKTREPFIGGLNIFSFTSNLFFPFEDFSSKILGGSQIFSTGFGWWESLVFIGPLSITGLIYIVRSAFKKRSQEASILIVLSVLFLLLSTPDSRLNPIHYIISRVDILQYFHVPSRILAIWEMVILIGFGLYLDHWKKRSIAIFLLLVNFFAILFFSQYVLATRDYAKITEGYEEPLIWISKNNPNQFFTIHSTSQGEIPQDKAYLLNVPLLQSNYGLFIKNSPAEKYNFRGNKSYSDLPAGFLITNIATNSSNLNLVNKYKNNIYLYKNSDAKPFATIGGKPQKAQINVNKISITSNSSVGKLLVYQTNYPGWKAYIDKREVPLISDRFLSIKTKSGIHIYDFVFFPSIFIYGAVVSLAAILLWSIYCYKQILIDKKPLI